MQPMRNEIFAEIPDIPWRQESADPIISDGPQNIFDPVIGICVGLGLGIVSWSLMFLVWYAFFS